MAPILAVQEFISRLQALPPGPGVSLDDVLEPALDDETQLRKLFATERQHDRLADPHVGLVDVFDAPDVIRTTRARIVQGPDDLSARYAMPLDEAKRRKEDTPCMVASSGGVQEELGHLHRGGSDLDSQNHWSMMACY